LAVRRAVVRQRIEGRSPPETSSVTGDGRADGPHIAASIDQSESLVTAVAKES
jgi:hypothetical protein